MSGITRGVPYYTCGIAHIYFPTDRVSCELCPVLETYARKQCRLTGEYLADTRGVGYLCPLEFVEREEEHGEPCGLHKAGRDPAGVESPEGTI